MTKSNSISIISKNQTMSSREIAKLTEKRHADVIRDIRKMIDSIKDDANMLHVLNQGLTEQKDERGYVKQFILNRFLTELLVTGYDILRRARVLAILVELENKAIEKQNFALSRKVLKDEYLPMTNAIKEAHEEIKPYHFSNEADLINRIVLGCTASKFRKNHEIDKNEPIRDYLNQSQLDCVIALQRANTVYLEDGLDFQERKEKLTSLFNRKHKHKIIAEIHLLHA